MLAIPRQAVRCPFAPCTAFGFKLKTPQLTKNFLQKYSAKNRMLYFENESFPSFGPEFDSFLVLVSLRQNCARIQRFHIIRVSFERKADAPIRWKH